MEKTTFFHVCADGADAKNFITCEEDFRTAFNLVGVCAANCAAVVLAFCIEDSHPHFLLHGTQAQCAEFHCLFEKSYKKYLARSRGSLDGVVLECSMIEIESQDHLMYVGTYVINQATKDGKKVMPYDYQWGSGSLYFRSNSHIPIWCWDSKCRMCPIVKARDISFDRRREISHSHMAIPDNWLICNGLILPNNYIDVESYENIYRTHNCFRTFMSSSRSRDEIVIQALTEARGITMEDIEIRKPCGDLAKQLFGIRDVRRLNAEQRLQLGLEMRKKYRLSRRQIATIVRLPLAEIERYIR